MGSNDLCDAGLVLGLGFSSSAGDQKSKTTTTAGQNLSLTLSLSGETYEHEINHASNKPNCSDNNNNINNQLSADLYRQDSAASSFSNVSVKREREMGSEEAEIERFPSRISDEDDEYSNGRKKLRLNKAQSALLEESFKIHSTLNPKQKQELARELKLRPRQVEVWFQNRRARTKLKQTEIDCEFLKKCCESLTDENRRLQKEVEELKALKSAQPLYMQLPAATLTMCPSCERIGGGAPDNSAKSSFTKPQFYNPFTKPSAAC